MFFKKNIEKELKKRNVEVTDEIRERIKNMKENKELNFKEEGIINVLVCADRHKKNNKPAKIEWLMQNPTCPVCLRPINKETLDCPCGVIKDTTGWKGEGK